MIRGLYWLIGVGLLVAAVVHSVIGDAEWARFLILAGLLFTLHAKVEWIAIKRSNKEVPNGQK